MLGKCFFIICFFSVVCAVLCGNTAELANAVIDGAGKGVTLSLSLLGMMCLWCGVIEVLKDCGAIGILSRILRPVLRRVFPESFESGVAVDEITASVAANILGVANAATPFALRAMEKMDAANETPEKATDDMVTLSVLGSSSIDIMPTTIIALRRTAGSLAPYAIIVPVWICSVSCAAFGMILCRLLSRGSRKYRRRSIGKPDENLTENKKFNKKSLKNGGIGA